MKLSSKTQDKLAMHLWAALKGVTKRIEERWEFIKGDAVTDTYRTAVRKALTEVNKS